MTRSTFVLTAVVLATIAASGTRAMHPIGSAGTIRNDAPAQVVVFNTQLRGIIDPDIQPTGAWGHVQLKLTEAGDGTWVAEWKGRLYNPDGHQFTAGFVIDLDADGGGDPGDPSDGGGIILDSAILDLFTDASASCGIIDFESQAITDEEHMPADVAQRMIIDPEIFGVVLVSTDGPIVFGRFGPGDPEPVSGDGLGGRPVRCAAGD